MDMDGPDGSILHCLDRATIDHGHVGVDVDVVSPQVLGILVVIGNVTAVLANCVAPIATDTAAIGTHLTC